MPNNHNNTPAFVPYSVVSKLGEETSDQSPGVGGGPPVPAGYAFSAHSSLVADGVLMMLS